MNRHIAIAIIAASATAAGSAFAADYNAHNPVFDGSSRTRAEVQAELAQYKLSGVNPWSISYNPLRSFESTKTRAQVTAELDAAREQVAAFTREDSGSAYLARRAVRSQAQQFAGQPPIVR